MRSLLYGLVAMGLAASASAPMPWSTEELSVLRTLWIGALERPADPSNRYAGNSQAAELGRALFFDRWLSANGQIACASCHDPDHAFTDARPMGQGIGQGGRRTMPIPPATYETWQFWDGRADRLWAQALGPIENPQFESTKDSQLQSELLSRRRRIGQCSRLQRIENDLIGVCFPR